MPKEARDKRAYEIATTAYKWAQVALHIMTLDKEELVAKTRENYQVLGETLLASPDAEAAARDLLEIIQSGMARLAVAVAVVETDPNFDPDGGEDIPEEDDAGEAAAA